jgi:hypothetical protein
VLGTVHLCASEGGQAIRGESDDHAASVVGRGMLLKEPALCHP